MIKGRMCPEDINRKILPKILEKFRKKLHNNPEGRKILPIREITGRSDVWKTDKYAFRRAE